MLHFPSVSFGTIGIGPKVKKKRNVPSRLASLAHGHYALAHALSDLGRHD